MCRRVPCGTVLHDYSSSVLLRTAPISSSLVRVTRFQDLHPCRYLPKKDKKKLFLLCSISTNNTNVRHTTFLAAQPISSRNRENVTCSREPQNDQLSRSEKNQNELFFSQISIEKRRNRLNQTNCFTRCSAVSSWISSLLLRPPRHCLLQMKPSTTLCKMDTDTSFSVPTTIPTTCLIRNTSTILSMINTLTTRQLRNT